MSDANLTPTARDVADAELERLQELCVAVGKAEAAYDAVPDLNARIAANPRDPVALDVCGNYATAFEEFHHAADPTTVATLVASVRRLRAALAAEREAGAREEREACARLCDEAARKNWGGGDGDSPEAIAAAIRSRT